MQLHERTDMTQKIVRSSLIVAGGGILVFCTATMSFSQTAPATKGAPESNSERLRSLSGFGFDDLMTMLIQPRHLKLYYAGIQKNWEVAAAESRDLRAAFLRITLANQRYLNNDVDSAVATIMTPTMNAIDSAIAAGNSKDFDKAYADLTAGCNACHVYMEHPFFVIKVPAVDTSSFYPDQDFSSRH
jgi:hypothetical protein